MHPPSHQLLTFSEMIRPLDRDPILDESCQYHERARRQCLRKAAKFADLRNRVYDTIDRVRSHKLKEYFRRALHEVMSMQEYEMACADYHTKMLLHWNNCQRLGYVNHAVPRVPQLPLFML